MLSLSLAGVEVRFPGLDTPGLRIERLEIPAGAQVVLSGPSGSGKSTLVNVITGLLRPAAGAVGWNGTDIAALSEPARDRWRGANVGLVMQDFHLFPGLSARENVLLPARLARVAGKETVTRAVALLDRVGLSRPDQPIETMSRGEMQRVAVARALLGKPAVLVADEPTASLDAASGAVVGDLLTELADEENATLIAVTHDPRLASRLQRRLRLVAGRIVEDTAQTAVPPTAASAATAQQGQVTS